MSSARSLVLEPIAVGSFVGTLIAGPAAASAQATLPATSSTHHAS